MIVNPLKKTNLFFGTLFTNVIVEHVDFVWYANVKYGCLLNIRFCGICTEHVSILWDCICHR